MVRTTTVLCAWAVVTLLAGPAAADSAADDADGGASEIENVTGDTAPGPSDKSLELRFFLGAWFPNHYHHYYGDGISGIHELHTVNPRVGLGFGFYPVKYAGAEVEGLYTLSGTDDGEAHILDARLQVVGQYPGTLTPFVTAGFGLSYMTSPSYVLGSDSTYFGHLGVGVKYFVADRIALRLGARLLRGQSIGPVNDSGANFGEILFGISYHHPLSKKAASPPDPDPDGDGILAEADLCPDVPGVEPDGCPPKDTDNDGILDPDDKCPNEPEKVNGWEDEDGCADVVPDSDNDGIDDLSDKCREQAEDKDGFQDEDGCPDLDNDGDGITDMTDGCPNEAGPPENRGCPDTDKDGDGVVDRLDNCPDEAGSAENHGCVEKQLVVLTKEQLKILDKVYFRTGRARIRHRSRKLLNNVAAVLKAHPEIKKVRVEGHTDNQGKPAANKVLSQKRAEAVVAYLVKQGVDPGRLEPVGFGQEKPIADNATRAGKAANRRVEFNIVGDQE